MDSTINEYEEVRVVKVDDRTTVYQKTLRYLYRLFLPLMFSTLILAWALYPERYDWRYEYVSDLGGLTSKQEGLNNIVASRVMSIGFALVVAIALTIAIIYFINKEVIKWRRIMLGIFNLLITIGAAGVGIPTKHPVIGRFHQIGAMIFLFMFAITNMSLQGTRSRSKFKRRSEEKKTDFTIDITIAALVLFAFLLLCVFYIVDEWLGIAALSSSAEVMQKVVLIVDCIAIYRLDVDDM